MTVVLINLINEHILLALIFKIIVFVSPGWAVVKSDIYVEPTDAMLPQDDGIHPEMQPFTCMKSIINQVGLNIGKMDNVSIYTHVKSIY
jgi:hypothetical protein